MVLGRDRTHYFLCRIVGRISGVHSVTNVNTPPSFPLLLSQTPSAPVPRHVVTTGLGLLG